MTMPADARLRRLQEEVARDPGSAAFAPLADLYRAQGRLDVARRVCIRGLERHPDDVEGHYLLGRIHRDAGEVERAYDEWDITLALDPSHHAARRSIAVLSLERGQILEAEKHLRRALADDPDDPRIRRTLGTLAAGEPELGSSYWAAAAPLLKRSLDHFAREARVRDLVVLDLRGRIVARLGFSDETDLAAVASLAAGVHAASREMARMLGQRHFSQLFQGAREHQIFVGSLSAPPGELLLLAVFGQESTIGLVRALFREEAARLKAADWPPRTSGGAAESLEDALAAGLARARLDRRGEPLGTPL